MQSINVTQVKVVFCFTDKVSKAFKNSLYTFYTQDILVVEVAAVAQVADAGVAGPGQRLERHRRLLDQLPLADALVHVYLQLRHRLVRLHGRRHFRPASFFLFNLAEPGLSWGMWNLLS